MVGPTAAGRVLSVKVDVGDRVKAGQLLAEMDPVDITQRLTALDASLARAGSARAAAEAQLLDASARKKLATLNTQRNQDLARKNFISSGALDAKLQEQASAEAAVQAAQANLAGAGQDAARLNAERAALAQQRDNVRLFAPADAVVTTRDAEAGSTVVAGQPVLRLMDPSSLWVSMRVDQGRSAGLATGIKASIVLRSNPKMPLSGQVARIELLADSVTEERIAQVAFDAPSAGLSVGEMAEVTLQLPATAPALLLPTAAIQHQNGQTGVWRIQDGKPEFAKVQLGTQSLDGQVQVLKGLDKSDRVVVYSQKALTSGARLSIVDAIVKPGADK
jgi:HlyD family secretion protein